ncbi:MAG: hypothetical protein PHQ89_03440 [Bacilli bacterium]|nr:hypothetical protein [Bacilli bacterium]
MNDNLYAYLAKCIQKSRYGNFKQDELVAGICSKYTLSRIENGKAPANKKIIRALIDRLGYYYKDVVDLTIIHTLCKHLIAVIEYNNIKEIISDIKKMEKILLRNERNILFLDYNLLYYYLKSHYIDHTLIHLNKYDLNTLTNHDDIFNTIILSVIAENMLHNGKLHEFICIYEGLPIKKGNIILDFFQMLYLQYNGQSLKVNDLFNYHKEEIKKDMKTYQLIRYRSVLALGYVEYEPDKAMRQFEKITSVYQKYNCNNNYIFIAILGKVSIFIKNKDYKASFTCLDEFIKELPFLAIYAIPYIIFLSFRIDAQVDNLYLQHGYSELCDASIKYYYFRSSTLSGVEHVHYLSKHFPHLLKNYCINDPFITILRKEELYQVDRSHCYKTGVRFLKKLKDNCKEVIVL